MVDFYHGKSMDSTRTMAKMQSNKELTIVSTKKTSTGKIQKIVLREQAQNL